MIRVPAPRFTRRVVIVVLCCSFLGCGVFGDEGVWLGEKIASAAEQLRHSTQAELVISYAPKAGVDQRYSVGVGKSVWCPAPPCYENRGGLTVQVEHGRHGSTTYHTTFVAVPRPLEVHKVGQPTQVVLRKNKDVIELVELR